MLDQIQSKIARRQYELSKHAVDQTISRHITIREVEQAFEGNCEIIEDYPDDKYWPSCLVLGFTNFGRPLHIHCSHAIRPIVKIITLYEPDPAIWLNFRIRKNHGRET